VRGDFYADYFELEDRHWWFLGRRTIFLRMLDRYLPPETEGRRQALDVGCGTGTMIVHLARYGEVRGIDADEQAVEFCRRRGIQRVQRVDALPLPFPSESFDLVTTFDVLEHLEDDGAMLGEIHRVLRPGGTLLASVPAYRMLWGVQDEISNHHRRYRRGELGRRTLDAGFAIERLTYFNTLLFPPIAAIRLLRRWLPLPEPRSDFEMTKPGVGNTVLSRLFALEAPLLERIDLPFGVSILALARRDGRQAAGLGAPPGGASR
jgi:SAM-dependent methyltransferase